MLDEKNLSKLYDLSAISIKPCEDNDEKLEFEKFKLDAEEAHNLLQTKYTKVCIFINTLAIAEVIFKTKFLPFFAKVNET